MSIGARERSRFRVGIVLIALALVVASAVVSSASVAAVSQPGAAGGDDPRSATLTPTRDESAGNETSIAGTVTDAETGEPISNASVTVIGDSQTDETTTDSEGAFELAGLPGDRDYAVTVEKRGYEPTTETTTVPAGETATVDVSLAGVGSIAVAVTDAHFDEPIESATVEATGARGTYSGVRVSDGTYRIENVPSRGDYELRVHATGYVEDRRTVSPSTGEGRVESIALRGDAVLEVVVETEDGELIENATVSITRDEAAFDAASTTDDAGTLAVTVPGTGESYTVAASAPAFEASSVATGAVESEETATVTVALPAPLPISISKFATATIVAVMALTVVAGSLLARTSRSES
ncbi:carboxypeptidase regulatory-like domain-containing protein [Natrinema sp. DC36]|uniref:carboxypeptidase regulatory-like domain-containing protein n=1 Tax=Natrinema sp. DC36 TaxID=2878680 RepID=UPI001CF0C055|nr:carboxypeptidase regulatory-like domain-containing protein [Natrinema sp. DC36]